MEPTSHTTPGSTAPNTARPSFDQGTEQLDTKYVRPLSEFDPCAKAHITSPFYLYKHDSPRPSGDSKQRPPIHISVKDLEAGAAETLTPVSTRMPQEKRGSDDSGMLNIWNRAKPKRCMTKKHASRWQSLTQRQRFITKIVVLLVLLGLIIGLAVGISIATHSGVWSGDNSSKNIPT